MKCLIVAAGLGIRLKEKGKIKPLVPILGVSLIERVIRSAMIAEIEEFIVVVGNHNAVMMTSFLDKLRGHLNIKIGCVINHEWKRENGISVLKARKHLDKSFLLIMGDHLFDPSIVANLTKTPFLENEILLCVDYAINNAMIDQDEATKVEAINNKIVKIGKTLSTFNCFDTGIFLCTPSIFETLDYLEKRNKEVPFSKAVKALAEKNKAGIFEIQNAFWIDVDDPVALGKAERYLLNRLKKGKHSDGPVSKYLNRSLSIKVSKIIAKTNITPNQISISTFLLSLLATWLFTAGNYFTLLLGGIIAQIASIIDGCDGEVARLKFQTSDYGAWLDAVLDRYADAFLLFGLSWHCYANSANVIALTVGTLSIIGSLVCSYTADKHDSIALKRGGKKYIFRIGRDIRVFAILLGAVFNQPLSVLYVIAVIMNAETIRRLIVYRKSNDD